MTGTASSRYMSGCIQRGVKILTVTQGKTPLKGWDVFNFRAGYQFAEKEEKLPLLNGLSLNFGIDNMFDKKYTMANSYEYDPTDPVAANVKIVNEPGRFIYASLSYSF